MLFNHVLVDRGFFEGFEIPFIQLVFLILKLYHLSIKQIELFF